MEVGQIKKRRGEKQKRKVWYKDFKFREISPKKFEACDDNTAEALITQKSANFVKDQRLDNQNPNRMK